MKTSFYLFIVILFCSISKLSNAQTFGLKAGGHLSLMHVETDEYSIPYNTLGQTTYSMSPGYNFGATVEFGIIKSLKVETGLGFSMKGLKFVGEEQSFGNSILTSDGKTDLYYIEMPLNLIIPFSAGGMHFFGAVGPYAGYGLSGKKVTSSTFEDLTEKTTKSITWGTEPGTADFRRFDYGVSAAVGIDIQPIQISISYSKGLENISPRRDYGSVTGHQTIGLSLAYKFGKIRKQAEEIPPAKIIKEEPKTDKPSGKKAAILEAERLRIEKLRTDSLLTVQAAEEKARIEKMKNDSIAAEKTRQEQLEAERMRLAKLKSDSIALAEKVASVKPAEINIVYRIQFSSSVKATGSQMVTIDGKEYKTWEYQYSGAYRSTVGEFRTFAEAARFQSVVRKSGYPQAFVVVFKNNIRNTDPALLK